ncbi:hypothetical protein OS493_036929 [Desmophyllum pertusum]|uniref:DUF218 domain-containing protein n=1 Tax=Desmophyllum pertusum TaxID=174260 RepID=A0A9W9ZVL0_9CNID|nr:hypothetical protein OS493_036929 [Desmophyllum pertusum]
MEEKIWQQADNPTDIIIVHGSRTNEDGSPTEMLKSRINRAAELYTSLKQQNIDCRVIVTGYQAPDQQVVTEASAMEKYAVDNNLIDSEHIIKEEQASSTAENAYYGRIIVDQYDASNVHVVTSQCIWREQRNFLRSSTRQTFTMWNFTTALMIWMTRRGKIEKTEKKSIFRS